MASFFQSQSRDWRQFVRQTRHERPLAGFVPSILPLHILFRLTFSFQPTLRALCYSGLQPPLAALSRLLSGLSHEPF